MTIPVYGGVHTEEDICVCLANKHKSVQSLQDTLTHIYVSFKHPPAEPGITCHMTEEHVALAALHLTLVPRDQILHELSKQSLVAPEGRWPVL